MTVFLGIDQSLQRTGLVVLGIDGELRHRQPVATGSLRGAPRLAAIRDTVRAVIREHKPSHAALEGYSYGSTGKVFQLGEVGGILQLLLLDEGIPFTIIAPAQLKKYVANNHQADKATMLRKTAEKWGVSFGDEDDVCDAYGLAQVLRGMFRKDTTLRYELEVILELTTSPKKKTRALQATKGKVTVSV